MDAVLRRIVAVGAQAIRTGRCPTVIHSLGNGETAAIRPTVDGFVDEPSGLGVRLEPPGLLVEGFRQPLELAMEDDVFFAGFDPASGERFTGRCGGGASVTIYAGGSSDFHQYAVASDPPSPS